MSMSKTRIERLEKADQSKEIELILAYQSPTSDYMEIEKFCFKGTIKEGKEIINGLNGVIFVVHYIP